MAERRREEAVRRRREQERRSCELRCNPLPDSLKDRKGGKKIIS